MDVQLLRCALTVFALAWAGGAVAQSTPAATAEEAAMRRARAFGMTPEQTRCFVPMFVARAQRMPNGRWQVQPDRRTGGTAFQDEVRRACNIPFQGRGRPSG